MNTQVLYTNRVGETLDALIGGMDAPKTVVVADENTARLCLPQLRAASAVISQAEVLTVAPGDENKNLEAAAGLWQGLGRAGCTRRSVVVNLGGGVVSDMGGFVASTFKRGMRYINVPTTLLGAVDASVGGKTGINFGMLKNEVGVFAAPYATVACSCFFPTLPQQQLLSGYGEVLKHALLCDDPAELARVMDFDIGSIAERPDDFLPVLQRNMSVKLRIVESDPLEKGPRKALNLGHTAGHAFETLCMRRGAPVPHGYAVAWGCVVALVLSRMLAGLHSDVLYSVASFVRSHYGSVHITCDDYPQLLELMGHDKKNATPDRISFTLLNAPGRAVVDSVVPRADIEAALDIYRDLML